MRKNEDAGLWVFHPYGSASKNEFRSQSSFLPESNRLASASRASAGWQFRHCNSFLGDQKRIFIISSTDRSRTVAHGVQQIFTTHLSLVIFPFRNLVYFFHFLDDRILLDRRAKRLAAARVLVAQLLALGKRIAKEDVPHANCPVRFQLVNVQRDWHFSLPADDTVPDLTDARHSALSIRAK